MATREEMAKSLDAAASKVEKFAKDLAALIVEHAEALGVEPNAEALDAEPHVVAVTLNDGPDLFIEIAES